MAMSDNMRKVLQKLGDPAVLTRVTGGTFDPATGTSTPSTETSYDASAVAEPYELSEVDGTRVLRTDAKITISKTAVRPAVGDSISFDGSTYRIMWVYPPRMFGEDVIYQVQGRI